MAVRVTATDSRFTFLVNKGPRDVNPSLKNNECACQGPDTA